MSKTPREVFGLLDKLYEQQVRERGERLSLAGGDGEDYIRETLGEEEAQEFDKKEHDDFAVREMARMIREANELAEKENGK